MLSDALSKLTDEHDTKDKLLKSKQLELEKKEMDFETQQTELLALRDASKSSASLLEDKIKELKQASDETQAKAEQDHKNALQSLSASLLVQKGSQEKQSQVLTPIHKYRTCVVSCLLQLRAIVIFHPSFYHVIQDHVDLLAGSEQSAATIQQLREEIVALTSSKDGLATKLESRNKEITDLTVSPPLK